MHLMHTINTWVDSGRKHSQDEVIITDFALFNYQDPDTLSDSISRNLFHILNLMLLAILGFAGAYVAILRYDVR